MRVRPVQSKQNPRLKELRAVLRSPGRDTEKSGGLVAIEGPNLLDEAMHSGMTVETIFAAHEEDLRGLKIAPETEVLLVPADILSGFLSTESPQPVAALIREPEWRWNHLLRQPELIVVLAALQDPGNLGTIVRSAEAFGATGIVALPGTVSAWNAKAVRASAGSVLRMPVITASAEECFAQLRKAGVQVLATAIEKATPAASVNWTTPIAVMIGNEGNGIPPEWAAQASGTVTIPCPGPVESLNAAVATSVLLYEAARQRGAQ